MRYLAPTADYFRTRVTWLKPIIVFLLCVRLLLWWLCISLYRPVIIPRPAGGGGQRAPCGFSEIAPEALGISL